QTQVTELRSITPQSPLRSTCDAERRAGPRTGNVAGTEVEVGRQARAEGDAQFDRGQPVQERLLEVERKAIEVVIPRPGEGRTYPLGVEHGRTKACDLLRVVKVVVAEADPVARDGAVVIRDGRIDDGRAAVI